MLTDCDKTLGTVYAYLGRLPASVTFTYEDLEIAFRHVKRCSHCRETISPEERSKFVSGIVLERE